MTISRARMLAACAAMTLSAMPAFAQAANAGKPAAQPVKHETMAQLRAEARVSEVAARATALAKVPGGRVKTWELERENGTLLYSFDIATRGKSGIDEVHVNAITGALIGDVVHETPKMEKAEAKAEAKEAKAAGKEMKHDMKDMKKP